MLRPQQRPSIKSETMVWDPDIYNFESFLSDSSVHLPEMKRKGRKQFFLKVRFRDQQHQHHPGNY